jgi:hypothetical protein
MVPAVTPIAREEIMIFIKDMSFGNAMAVVSVAPASASMSTTQIKAAVVTKYGTAEGDAINGQFGQAISDSADNCSGSAASSATPAAPTGEANAALARFNAANGGVLNGTIQPS